MSTTVYGIVADPLGHALAPEQRRRAWSTPALELRSEQPARVPVDVGHSHDWIGQVVHLERHPRSGDIWAVAVVDGTPGTVNVLVGDRLVPVQTEMFWSAERIGTEDDRDIILRSLSITSSPARINARPLTFLEGDLGQKFNWRLERGSFQEQLLTRASESRFKRRSAPLVVHDQNRPPDGGYTQVRDGAWLGPDGELVTAHGPAGWRVRGSTILDVS